VRDRSK
jgi:hypothetical protein